MISYEKIDWDSAVRISALPKTRTNPLGTTVLYPKSNKSPTRKIASASLYLIEPCHESLFSWQTNAAVGAPKC
jgi:hypothetical protein